MKLQEISKKAGAAGQEAAQKELAEMMVKAKEMAEKEEAEAAAAALRPEVGIDLSQCYCFPRQQNAV